MSTTTIKIGLFDPGMSDLHRAGLGGMAMSLAAITRDRPIPGLDYTIRKDAITLCFAKDDAAALVRLVEAAMYCERGLIRFAAFSDQTQADILHMNECLLGTLLQHPKMLAGAKKLETTIEIEGKPYVFRVKHLEDFVHRSTARTKLVDSDGRLTSKPIKIKGWAIPGAAQRHDTVTASALSEPPERLLPLLFTPIGAIPMRVLGNVGAKYRFVLLIPEVTRLDSFAKQRQRMASTDNMICAGPGDASLRFFAELTRAKQVRRLPGHCTAVTLGTVTWSSQQKSRTNVLELDKPAPRALEVYNIINAHTQFEILRSPKGQGFRTVPAWRHFLTENLAAGRPLWSGLHRATATDGDRRNRMFKYERPQIKEIIHEMSDRKLLGSEIERRFVEAWHQAICQRWGGLNARIARDRLHRGQHFERDFEDMRIALTRCKNAETFRSAVVDIWARAGRNRVLNEHWRDILVYLRADNWQLGRDLALLALASYGGKGKDDLEESDESEEYDEHEEEENEQ